MFDKIKKMLSGSKPAEPESEPAIEYDGFTIQAHPRNEGGGWSTEATITRVIDGEQHSHHFIRADKTGSRDGAVELTINKCRQTIDQLGDNIFS